MNIQPCATFIFRFSFDFSMFTILTQPGVDCQAEDNQTLLMFKTRIKQLKMPIIVYLNLSLPEIE